MPLRDALLKQAGHAYSPRQRAALLVAAGLVFLVLLPWLLATLSASLDAALRLPRFARGLPTTALGGLLVAGGWLLGGWSVYVQFTLGRGTPVPLMATQKLVVQPPYTYCRNPMALGAFVLYLGAAVVLGSLSAVGLVALGAVALLTWVKRVEEKELEARFGEEYARYRQRTPFLVPRLRK